MEVVVSYDNPRNVEEWNALCKDCGNFVQTTMYSEISAFYGNKSIYIQVYDGEFLAGGLKLMLSQSGKLPMLSKRLGQFGEIVVCFENDASVVVKIINAEVEKLIAKLKPCVFSVKGFYGGKELLCNIKKFKCSEVEYGLAYLDLEKSEEDLLKNMEKRHRKRILKGIESNLDFFLSHDATYLIDMLKETYSLQEKAAPNQKFVELEIEIGEKYGVSSVGVTKSGDEVLSASEIVIYGDIAYLTLGGNKRSSIGAGQFAKWNLLLEAKKRGCKKLSFGQVAQNRNFGDAHFIDGISEFKLNFGCYVVDTCNRQYILRPIYNRIWNILCKMFIRK